MAMLAVGPIKQAFVRALRGIAALKAEVGSNGFYEGIALTGSGYPFVCYSVGSVVRSRQFGSDGITKITFDVWVADRDQVEAHNLDQLILDGLEDVDLDFSETTVSEYEPSTLLCHRVTDLSLTELDDAGNKVYLVGGTYHVWLDRI